MHGRSRRRTFQIIPPLVRSGNTLRQFRRLPKRHSGGCFCRVVIVKLIAFFVFPFVVRGIPARLPFATVTVRRLSRSVDRFRPTCTAVSCFILAGVPLVYVYIITYPVGYFNSHNIQTFTIFLVPFSQKRKKRTAPKGCPIVY